MSVVDIFKAVVCDSWASCGITALGGALVGKAWKLLRAARAVKKGNKAASAASAAAAAAALAKRKLIAEGDFVIGIAFSEGPLAGQIKWGYGALASHTSVAQANKAWLGVQKLIQGAAAVTVSKTDGQIIVIGSNNFGTVLSIPDWAIALAKSLTK